MEKLIIVTIHLPLCRFVPNERTEGPLEGHRGFAVLPFLYLKNLEEKDGQTRIRRSVSA